MPIKELIEFVGKENLVDEVLEGEKGEQILSDLGGKVKRDFDRDWSSMGDWMHAVDEGLKLMQQEYRTKSTPWDGASNFKSPMLSEASIAFGDKASLEILRARNLVKTDVIGKDRDGSKKELSSRVGEAMNYQVNYQMKDWRRDQKRMLYILPNVGCMFKKTVYDPLQGKTASHVIQYPDFAVNQATINMSECQTFTQILDVDLNGLIERQAAGTWRDISIYPEGSEGGEGSKESAETETANDNPDRFLEQQCFFDLDDDGYEEPYIVTIHEQTMTVMRIVARYDDRSFIVKTPEGRVVNLVEAIKQESAALINQGFQPPEIADIDKYDLVRIEPIQPVTKYGFIPSPDGTFLDLGYSHLLGAIVQGVNTSTNQLTDAGTLRNAGGGFLAKGFRKKMGTLQVKPGHYNSTDIAARDLHSGVLPNPNPEPSAVLFALNEKLEQKGRQFAAIVDTSGQIQGNTAPTTALAIIQEALIPTSALMGRVLDGMSDEFQILYSLNKRTFDPELYKTVLDDPGANASADFNDESLDIVPTATPEMSSKMQRMQLATVEMENIPAVISAGGNPLPIVRNFFDRIGSQNLDEIFPEQPTDQQAAEIKLFRESQDIENQLQAHQLELAQLQTELLGREQERLDAETNIKIQKTIGELEKLRTESILNLEKAESEEVKNQINKYTAELSGTISMLTAIGAENDRRNASRSEVAPQSAADLTGRL